MVWPVCSDVEEQHWVVRRKMVRKIYQTQYCHLPHHQNQMSSWNLYPSSISKLETFPPKPIYIWNQMKHDFFFDFWFWFWVASLALELFILFLFAFLTLTNFDIRPTLLGRLKGGLDSQQLEQKHTRFDFFIFILFLF